MMQHVWDNFEYSQDLDWYKSQGYPLIKGVAQFWISQLQKDTFSKDGMLVVNPCNSPEHGPTTFGCTHYQQVIHQVFEAVLSSETLVSETDKSFINQTATTLAALDKGLHIGSWGELKEWKIPDSYGYDYLNDTHRHLSQFVGWFPGYSVASFLSGYTNSTIGSAIATSLRSRGNGNAADANSGWAKVWRVACWARLNETTEAYKELRYAITSNFAPNGMAMYTGQYAPFQIDANFGFAGAVLSMLAVDLPLTASRMGEKRIVILGPAIPAAWSNGKARGLRLRGGGSVDFEWDAAGVVTVAKLSNRKDSIRIVNRNGTVLAEI
jgi:alpha-L-fucosidase 2